MIREIQLKDKEKWEKLYKGYADFYKVEMNNEILQTVWNWLHDKNHEVKGLVYEVEDNIVGLVHYRRMPSPLRGQYIGFLDDLFVEPKYRSQKIVDLKRNKVNGSIKLKLYKGNITIVSRQTKGDAYSMKKVSFEENKTFNKSHIERFINFHKKKLR